MKSHKTRRKEARLAALDAVYADLMRKTSIKPGPEWEKYVKVGKATFIRCQGMRHGIKPPEQCGSRAMEGSIVCNVHGGKSTALAKAHRRKVEKQLGLYDVVKSRALQAEMDAIGEIPKEKLEGLDDELKLGVSLLRAYLKAVDDEEIRKKPSRLMWIVDNIARWKKTHWDMKYAPDVSFSRPQVEFLMAQVRVVILNVVRDPKDLARISEGFKKIGEDVKVGGLKG